MLSAQRNHKQVVCLCTHSTLPVANQVVGVVSLLVTADARLGLNPSRVAELESRTVVVKQFDDFQIVHYGGSEDYAKGYIDCQNNYNKALSAAGIGVKGE